MRLHALLFPLLLPLLLLPGCGKDGTGPARAVASIAVTPASPSVADGGTVQLSATLRDQSGQAFTAPPAGVTVAWSSADATIAMVSSAGLVSGERPGRAQITASAGGVSASTEVTVTQVATTLALTGGSGQQAVEASVLADSLKVRVTDRHGTPAAGVAVQFVVTGGGGSISPASVSSDAAGQAMAAWTLGAAGANSAEARVAGLTGSPVAFTAEAAPANQPPVAQDDAATTQEGTPVTIQVLANDSDPDGDALSVESVTAPANGTAVINPEQTVTYTPDSGFSGSDSFGYTISDGRGGSASASVVVTVTPLPLICNPIANYGKTWQGRIDGHWSDPQNWSPAGVPTASDNVFICAAATTPPVVDQPGVANDVRTENLLTLGTALVVNGNLVIHGSGGHLVLGGQQLTVAGRLSVGTNGSSLLTMTDAADRLIIGGDLSFSGGSTEGRLTAGEIQVAGNFSAGGTSFTAFTSTGTLVRFNGSAAQTVSFMFPGADRQRFHDLVITNPAGVTFSSNGFALGDVQLGAAAAAQMAANATLTVGGHVTSGAGSSLGGHALSVGGVLSVGGSYAVANTTFSGTDQTVPAGLSYQHVGVTGSVRLAGNTTTTGNWVTSGSGSHLVLGGHQLTVAGNFSAGINGGSLLTMTDAADRLIVGGNASFSGGSTEGRLTAGEIHVAGNFSAGGTSFTAFTSTGTLVRFNGSAAQTVSFMFPGADRQRFHDLQISNPSGISFNGDAHVSGSLDLVQQMTVPNTRTVTVVDTLFLRSTAVLNNDGTLNVGSCDKQAGHTINGTDPCP